MIALKDGAQSASGRGASGCPAGSSTTETQCTLCRFPLRRPDGGRWDSLYYESIDMEDAFHPQTILAYELNDEPLPIKNGAPLRLRLERQLGYKMAKYVMSIEIVEGLFQDTWGQRRLLGRSGI